MPSPVAEPELRQSEEDPDDTTGADLTPEQARTDAYRRRLLDGMAASIEERGLIDTTVADIVRHARTSRRTFYEHFTDRSDCFQQLALQHNEKAWQVVLAAIDHSAPIDEQMRTGMRAACRLLTTTPQVSISVVRDLPSLSPAARETQRRLRESAVDTLLSVLDSARPDPGTRSDEDRRLLARMAVGGVREIVVSTLEDGGDLPAESDEIVNGVLRLMEFAG